MSGKTVAFVSTFVVLTAYIAACTTGMTETWKTVNATSTMTWGTMFQFGFKDQVSFVHTRTSNALNSLKGVFVEKEIKILTTDSKEELENKKAEIEKRIEQLEKKKDSIQNEIENLNRLKSAAQSELNNKETEQPKPIEETVTEPSTNDNNVNEDNTNTENKEGEATTTTTENTEVEATTATTEKT